MDGCVCTCKHARAHDRGDNNLAAAVNFFYGAARKDYLFVSKELPNRFCVLEQQQPEKKLDVSNAFLNWLNEKSVFQIMAFKRL